MELGNYNQACTLLENAVATSPTDIDAHRQLAEALWQMGRQHEADCPHRSSDPFRFGACANIGPLLAKCYSPVEMTKRALERAEKAIEPGSYAGRTSGSCEAVSIISVMNCTASSG